MEFLEFFKAIIFGIIEGITEWLPISSTGHLLLADEFIMLNMSDGFKELFFVVIQLGAILAVVVLFWNKLFPLSFEHGAEIKKDTMILWSKVIVGIIPAGVIGLLFDDQIDELFYKNNTAIIAIALIFYGVLFIIIESRNKKRRPHIKHLSDLTYQTAFVIGLFQVFALVPGTSRSGATIIGAILIGTSRFVAAEFTFYLAIPVMFGASLLKILKFGFSFNGLEIGVLLTGTIVSFIVSVASIKFLMGYIKKHDFKAFGYYRIALGLLVLLYFFVIK